MILAAALAGKGDQSSAPRQIGPGDTVVVPEMPVPGSSTLKNILSIAQIASSAALVAAVAIP